MDEIKALEEKLRQTELELMNASRQKQRVEAILSKNQRRKYYLIGRYFYEKFEAECSMARLYDLMDQYLDSDDERAVFGLSNIQCDKET